MRKSVFLLAIAGLATLVLTGCSSPGISGPERKLGRGFSNVTEFMRMGEIRRSVEQAGVFHGPGMASTTGLIHGFNRSVTRTLAGAYEIATFPLPNGSGSDYGPIFLPEGRVYPDNYKPGLPADTMFAPDTNLGFSGGEIAPLIPGSRFKIFEN